MSRILFRTLAVALILSLASAVISAEEMWTSVVSLYIYDGERPVFADHFFEVLDQGEYILLPLTQLANYLELNLEYSSLENVISVSSDRGSVRISLKDNLYLDHPEWSTYEPTTFEDVFFVAPQVFEYVAGVSIEWQPLFQTVVVTLEELPNWLKSSQTDEQKAAKTDEEFILAKSKVRNGLTLFRYQFSSLFEYPAKKHTLSADWEVFGKVGPFSIHAIVDTDLINYAQHSSELKFIRAKHEAGNHLLVLGDHEAVWEASLGKVVVRGLYFQYARGNTTTNIAYKDFSGEVIPGSTVTLYVNNQLVASLSMGETVSGTYEFLRVPLRPNQLNYVRIVITKPTGEFEERHYQVAGEPRIFLPGTLMLQTAHGLYRPVTGALFQNRTHTVSLLAGSGSSSFFLDWHWLEKPNANPEDAFRLSLYGQPYGNMILNANAYGSLLNREEKISGSLNLKLYYASVIGSFKVYDVASDVSSIFPQRAGRGTTFALTYYPLTNWSIELLLADNEKDAVSHKQHQVAVSKILENPASTQVLLKVANDRQNFLLENKSSSKITVDWSLKERTNTAQLNSAFVFSNEDLYQGSTHTGQDQKIEALSSGSEMLGSWGIVTHKFNYVSQIRNGLNAQQRLSILGSVKATSGKHTGYATVSLSSSSGAGEGSSLFYLKSYSLRFIYDYLLQPGAHLSFNFINDRNLVNAKNTFESNLGLSYSEGKTELKATLSLAGNLPNLRSSRISATSEITTELKNGLTIKPRFNVGYYIPTDTLSFYAGLDFAHAISFTTGKPTFMPYTKETPRAFVSGRVFLDLNGNGLYDDGEPTVADISVKLDNRIVTSDEDGFFVFENIEHGEFILSFDLYSLPAVYTPVFEPRLLVVDEMSSVSVDMPLMIYGSVDGFVFIDFNKNGIFDRDDIPLNFAQVLLNGSKKTLTNGSGRFIFDHIPLGTATLSVDPESLPPNTKAEEVQIVLDEHRNDVYDLYIPVYVVENSSNNATNYLTNHKTTESEMN